MFSHVCFRKLSLVMLVIVSCVYFCLSPQSTFSLACHQGQCSVMLVIKAYV